MEFSEDCAELLVSSLKRIDEYLSLTDRSFIEGNVKFHEFSARELVLDQTDIEIQQEEDLINNIPKYVVTIRSNCQPFYARGVEIGGGREFSYSIDAEKINMLPHELVAYCLKHNDLDSDARLETIAKLDRPSDDRTPDFIYFTPKRNVIVYELKTFYNAGEEKIRNLCHKGMSLYRDHVRERAEFLNVGDQRVGVCLASIAVSQNLVCESLGLPRDLLKRCCMMYKLGLIAIEKARSLRISIPNISHENTSEEVEKHLEQWKGEVPNESDDPLMITKEYLKFIKELDANYTMGEVKRLFTGAMFKAHDYKEEGARWSVNLENWLERRDVDIGDQRIDMKAILQYPFVTNEESPLDQPFPIRDYIGEEETINVHAKLWREVINDSNEKWLKNSENFKEVFEINGKEVLLKPELVSKEARKKHRNSHQVVEASSRTARSRELAMIGINAKRLQNDKGKLKKEMADKKPFSRFVPTEDIDNFINRMDLLDKVTKECPYIEPVEDLINEANNAVGNDGSEFYSLVAFLKTRLGKSLANLDAIIQEVNLNRMKNLKDPSKFVLSYCKAASAYILMKPTRADQHIFFSILVPGRTVKDLDPVCKKGFHLSQCYISPFVSVDANKISHLINAPLMAYMFLQKQRQIWGCVDQEVNCRAMRHFLCQTLFYLEAKNQTSKEGQLLRYFYMEYTKGDDNINPFKVMEKWETRPRNRLIVWLQKRTIDVGSTMMERRPKVEVPDSAGDEERDVLRNMISWVDFEPFPNFETVMEFFYLCNLHNPEDGDKTRDCSNIVSKILEEEMKLRNSRPSWFGLSIHSPEKPIDMRSHEFCPKFTKFCALMAKRRMMRDTGMNEQLLNEHILRSVSAKLQGITLESMATMKASYVAEEPTKKWISGLPKKGKRKVVMPDGGNEDSDSEDDGEPLMKRNPDNEEKKVKCLEAAHGRLLKGVTSERPMLSIDTSMKEVKGRGNMLSCLFPKSQIGACREIYILDFDSRTLMLFLETVAREIDSMLENAYLTKGSKKIMSSHNHYKVLRDRGRAKHSRTCINSGDCTRWCQQFIMKSFAVDLEVILPDCKIKDICMQILNLITEKRIRIPSELLHRFIQRPRLNDYDVGINELKNQWLGASKFSDLTDPMSLFMKNRSNMMQGQTHFLSDVHHACYDQGVIELSKRLLKEVAPDAQTQITSKVTSDDWSQIVSVYTSRRPPKNVDQSYTATLERRKGKLATLICWGFAHLRGLANMKTSYVKSTIACKTQIEEFNSVWMLQGHVLAAPIKKIYAGIRIPLSSCMISRIQEFYNIKRSVLEDGGSLMLCDSMQVCQAICHYNSLGAQTQKHWPMVASELARLKHPAAGFFPLEPSKVSGLLGFKGALFQMCLSTKSTASCHKHLDSEELVGESMEGDPTTRLVLSSGNTSRYRRLVREVEADWNELEEFSGNHPSIMFKRAETKDETLFKIRSKVMTPGVSDSLDHVNAAKIHAASSYILTHEVLKHTVKKESGLEKERLSMLGYMKKLRDDLDLDSGEVEEMFPDHNLYSIILEANELLKEERIAFCKRRRNRYIELILPTVNTAGGVNFKEICKSKWFLERRTFSSQILELYFRHYQRKFPWLRTTYLESFEASPFNSHMAFGGFINKQVEKISRMKLFAPISVKESIFDTIVEMVKYSQMPGMVLRPLDKDQVEKYQERKITNTDAEKLMTNVVMTYSAPPRESEDDEIKGSLMTDDWLRCYDVRAFMDSQPQTQEVILMSAFLKKDDVAFQVLHDAMWKGFDVDGEINKRGTGYYALTLGNLQIRTDLREWKIIRIRVNRMDLFKSSIGKFCKLLQTKKLWYKEVSRTESWPSCDTWMTISGSLLEEKRLGSVAVMMDRNMSPMEKSTVNFVINKKRHRLELRTNNYVLVGCFSPSSKYIKLAALPVFPSWVSISKSNDLVKAWFMNKTMDKDKLNILIDLMYLEKKKHWVPAIKSDEGMPPVLTRLILWIKSSLTQRMAAMGIQWSKTEEGSELLKTPSMSPISRPSILRSPKSLSLSEISSDEEMASPKEVPREPAEKFMLQLDDFLDFDKAVAGFDSSSNFDDSSDLSDIEIEIETTVPKTPDKTSWADMVEKSTNLMVKDIEEEMDTYEIDYEFYLGEVEQGFMPDFVLCSAPIFKRHKIWDSLIHGIRVNQDDVCCVMKSYRKNASIVSKKLGFLLGCENSELVLEDEKLLSQWSEADIKKGLW